MGKKEKIWNCYNVKNEKKKEGGKTKGRENNIGDKEGDGIIAGTFTGSVGFSF
jgi:hypothetical protein